MTDKLAGLTLPAAPDLSSVGKLIGKSMDDFKNWQAQQPAPAVPEDVRDKVDEFDRIWSRFSHKEHGLLLRGVLTYLSARRLHETEDVAERLLWYGIATFTDLITELSFFIQPGTSLNLVDRAAVSARDAFTVAFKKKRDLMEQRVIDEVNRRLDEVLSGVDKEAKAVIESDRDLLASSFETARLELKKAEERVALLEAEVKSLTSARNKAEYDLGKAMKKLDSRDALASEVEGLRRLCQKIADLSVKHVGESAMNYIGELDTMARMGSRLDALAFSAYARQQGRKDVVSIGQAVTSEKPMHGLYLDYQKALPDDASKRALVASIIRRIMAA